MAKESKSSFLNISETCYFALDFEKGSVMVNYYAQATNLFCFGLGASLQQLNEILFSLTLFKI